MNTTELTRHCSRVATPTKPVAHRRQLLHPLLVATFVCLAAFTSSARADSPKRPLRLLLLWHSPDGHPRLTHEYQAGMKLIASLLQRQRVTERRIQPILVHANDPWREGPELLDGADAAALFVSEGAAWLSRDPKRLAGFQRLAGRGGGLAGIHWGIGTRKAEPIPAFLSLLGGCHGGPDRKYKVVTALASPAADGKRRHPVLRGLKPFEIKDEFYYRLKLATPTRRITSLLRVPIDGKTETVSWGFERPDGGRSFGFSGLHFHQNWSRAEYRRLVLQGLLWTLKQPIPESGIAVPLKPSDLELPRS